MCECERILETGRWRNQDVDFLCKLGLLRLLQNELYGFWLESPCPRPRLHSRHLSHHSAVSIAKWNHKGLSS